VPVIGLAVTWWDAGEGSREPPPQVKKIFLYTSSVASRVSARSSFIADLRNGGPESLSLPFTTVTKSTQSVQTPPRPKSDPGFESGFPD